MVVLGTKEKSVWFCKSCGNESPKWLGRCAACGQWNTMIEHKVENVKPRHLSSAQGTKNKALNLKEITSSGEQRISLGDSELDRLLGGGLVRGSLVLIGGEPGIGKSTLSLQIPLNCKGLKTLYVSGEESARQVKMRADRLSGAMDDCYIYSETLIENILEQANEIAPQLMIVDSVQTIYSRNIESSAGSVTQIKETTAMLLHYAKATSIPIILIGHITKDGYIAGPKVLEHIVDVVLQFEGDGKGAYRLLRSIKNRFGTTAELAVYEMSSKGLVEVENPSQILMPITDMSLSGSAISIMMEGLRPFLFEVQALVSTAAYGTAQRSATGFDVRRLNMILAVLEKRAGFRLSAKDVFLNMAGGLRITDPACDLAVAVAVLSSNFDYPLSPQICFAAELGLSGELRPVSHVERRILEAKRLGFKTIYICAASKFDRKIAEGIELVRLKDIPDLVRRIFRA